MFRSIHHVGIPKPGIGLLTTSLVVEGNPGLGESLQVQWEGEQRITDSRAIIRIASDILTIHMNDRIDILVRSDKVHRVTRRRRIPCGISTIDNVRTDRDPLLLIGNIGLRRYAIVVRSIVEWQCVCTHAKYSDTSSIVERPYIANITVVCIEAGRDSACLECTKLIQNIRIRRIRCEARC